MLSLSLSPSLPLSFSPSLSLSPSLFHLHLLPPFSSIHPLVLFSYSNKARRSDMRVETLIGQSKTMKVKPQAPQLLSYFLTQPEVLCKSYRWPLDNEPAFVFLFFTRLFTTSLIQQQNKPHSFTIQRKKKRKVPLHRHTDNQAQPFSRSSSFLPSLLPTFA